MFFDTVTHDSPENLVIEPQWQQLADDKSTHLPADTAVWLRDEGSLTKTLTEACLGEFNVKVQSEKNERAYPSENALLELEAPSLPLVREVRLCCDELPWIFARTIIPSESLDGAVGCLANLNNRPLGALLFADPDTERCCIEVACLEPKHVLYKKSCLHLSGSLPDEIWARRTLFRFLGEKILVNEVFLPLVTQANLRN